MKLLPTQAHTIVEKLNFRNGFVTAVTRDFKTKSVLMVAQQTKQAVLKTITSGLMHYWSRSRRKLWLKGERSRHYQRVRGIWVDCDGDALVYDVEQVGAACHEGYYSCFYRKLEKGKLKRVLERKFEPKEIYGYKICLALMDLFLLHARSVFNDSFFLAFLIQADEVNNQSINGPLRLENLEF